MITRIYGKYLRILSQRPKLTNLVSAAVISGGGDIIVQGLIEKRTVQEYEPARTLRFCAVSGCFTAVIATRWFVILDSIPFHRFVKFPRAIPFVKMIVDQFVFGPFLMAGILFNLRLLEYHSIERAVVSMKRDYVPVLTSCLQFWPIVQLFNFYVVPLQHRVTVIQMCGLVWNSYLSYSTQEKLPRSKVTAAT